MRTSLLSNFTIKIFILTTSLALVSGRASLTKSEPKARTDDLLAKRNCDPCGWDGATCCSSGEICYTDANNQAQCGTSKEAGVVNANAILTDHIGSAGGSGYWNYYTSTFVESNLVTRTEIFSEYVAAGHPTPVITPLAVPPVKEEPKCQYALNESPCGHICCQSGFYCLNPETGHCANAGAGSSGHLSSFLSVTASAPLRPTASTLVVVTAPGILTTTVPFEAPVATGANVEITSSASESDDGLSAGAIAGIVIGVILGIIFLALLCFFCCLKGAANRILAAFGFGGRGRRREEYVEEYHRHSHHGGHGHGNGQWYGQGRPSRPPKKKTGGLGGLGAAAAGLGTLGLLLGLKRKTNRRTEKSDYTSSSGYYSSDYTSASSSSSGDRSRDTRRSSRR